MVGGMAGVQRACDQRLTLTSTVLCVIRLGQQGLYDERSDQYLLLVSLYS